MLHFYADLGMLNKAVYWYQLNAFSRIEPATCACQVDTEPLNHQGWFKQLCFGTDYVIQQFSFMSLMRIYDMLERTGLVSSVCNWFLYFVHIYYMYYT